MADLISMLAACAGGGEKDPDFNQTVLLLHGDGTNGAQNNTFLDSSTNNFTITRNGNTTQGTFSPFSAEPGKWGNYFDGSGDFLESSDNAAFELGSGDFTIESWFYTTNLTNANTIFAKWAAANESYIFQILSSGTAIRFAYSTDGVNSTIRDYSATINTNEWYHVAVCRASGNTKVFLNGTQIDSTTSDNVTFYNGTSSVNIGKNQSSTTTLFFGYLSNVRLVKSAVYTSNFTPPTAPLTAITNTSLLTCQSNRFVDNSTNAFAITRNGDVRVTPFSPFAPTAAYSAGTNGGSGYFDGTGDYLTAADNAALELGSSNFTVEAWVYLAALPAVSNRIVEKGTAAPDISYLMGINSSGQFFFSFSENGTDQVTIATSASTIVANQWYHLAATRSGSTFTIWVNGVSSGTATSSLTIRDSTSTLRVANNFNDDRFLNGYISNLRIVKGTAVYTSGFTPPTAPVTAITNTSLLCNFTNAGIIDNTGKNNLETVGNAQIDTAVKKYGTGSLEFDGTGDWLLMPNTPDQQLGTGNFTIEFWVYLATGDTGSARGLVAKGTSTTGFLVSLDSSQKVVFTFATSTITSSGAITLDAWNHIAVVRSGTGSNQTKIYIGGTNDGTGTVSTDFNQTESMYVGANRTGGDPMKGFIDDVRITKGVARYTANFNPPTAAFPNE